MDELVKKLSKKKSNIIIRADGGVEELKKRLALNYIYVFFEETGTELGIFIDHQNCDFEKVDWDKGTGKARIEGAITLNYEKVRCVSEFSVKTMKGTGKLSNFEDENEYSAIITATKG